MKRPPELPIQLVSTDFDGTIFAEFENPPVPARLERLLGDLQARGAKWVINTGRDMSGLMEAMGRAGLRVLPDYLVLVEREIYFHDGARYRGLEEWNRRCALDHARLFARIRDKVPRLIEWILEHYQAEVYEDPWSPLCLLARNHDDAEAIEQFLESFCESVPECAVVRNDVYARFSHVDYDKGKALAEIGNRLGIGRAHTFAAGDHLNDLPMLRHERASWLAAPANAVPRVKEAVLRQGGTVSHASCGNGVLEALCKYLDGAGGSRPGGLPPEGPCPPSRRAGA